MKNRVEPLVGFEQLAGVFDAALAQAQSGKGAERHGRDGTPFCEQDIFVIARAHGVGFLTGQAEKKIRESAGLPVDRARAEVLGALVYLAAAILHRGAES